MSVTILLFASVAQAAGLRRLELPFEPGDTVATVGERLIARYPALQRFVPTLVYAVNEVYAKPGAPVADGDTLALIPPVSGG